MNNIMRTMSNIKIILIALALFVVGVTQAQDGQLSQYEAAPVMLNPALTGMYENSDFRMSSNVRSQWNSLSSSFLTTAFAYDISMEKKYGFGTYLNNYNMAGIMNTFQFGFTGAYNVSDSRADHTLSVGANLGLIYKKVNDQELLWDVQYNDGYFNNDLPSGENIQKGGRLMPEVALGMAYRSTSGRKRFNPFGNFALFHLTTPDEAIFRATKSDMPIRYSVNGGVRIMVINDLHLTPMGLYMRQGNDQHINVGVMGEYTLPGTKYAALFGCSYRYYDAIIAQVGFKHRSAVYRFSYDINTSPLKTYTNNNGAFEFSIIYRGTHSGRTRRVQSSAF